MVAILWLWFSLWLFDEAVAVAVGMGVRDILKARQFSSQLFVQKSFQGNCQVNCATKKFLQGNCQVIVFFPTNLSRQLSSQLCNKNLSSRQLSSRLFVKKIFHIFCPLGRCQNVCLSVCVSVCLCVHF